MNRVKKIGKSRRLGGPAAVAIAAVASVSVAVTGALPEAAADWKVSHDTWPVECKGNRVNDPHGARVSNRPCAYYLGTALPDSTFRVDYQYQTSNLNVRFGPSSSAGVCGWITRSSLASPTPGTLTGCSKATLEWLARRESIGKDFNQAQVPEGTSVDDAALTFAIQLDPPPANLNCEIFENYFDRVSVSSTGRATLNSGRFRDGTGVVPSRLAYRFTTRDGKAVVGMDLTTKRWGFVNYDCVKSKWSAQYKGWKAYSLETDPAKSKCITQECVWGVDNTAETRWNGLENAFPGIRDRVYP